MLVEHQFSSNVSVELMLVDVQGRSNRIAQPALASRAIQLANTLQALGGDARIEAISDMANTPDVVLLHYKSSVSSRPSKSEIARAAKVIASCQVRDLSEPTAPLYVTGTRAAVHPTTTTPGTDSVVFLVSTTVWYNHNRAKSGFPHDKATEELFLEDINRRLQCGSVTRAR